MKNDYMKLKFSNERLLCNGSERLYVCSEFIGGHKNKLYSLINFFIICNR